MHLAEAFDHLDPDQPTDLYRYYDANGRLLYVGISKSAVVRAMQHERTAAWWDQWATMTREVFASRDAALDAERAAIVGEAPAHNIVYRRDAQHPVHLFTRPQGGAHE